MHKLGLVRVSGLSMLPLLAPGDRCLVAYGASVRSGDVVLARVPTVGFVVKRLGNVAEDSAWLHSDNDAVGTDSRNWGAVPSSAILGRLILRFTWPPQRIARG